MDEATQATAEVETQAAPLPPDEFDFEAAFQRGRDEVVDTTATPDDGLTVESPQVEVGERKKRQYRRRKMGPVSPELEEMFTEAGIGSVGASGLDAFLRLCAAPPLLDAEKNQLKRVLAYYAQARMPKDAGKYQPEILLGMTLAFILVPRMGPIATTTAPGIRRFGSWIGDKMKRLFRRKDAQ